MLQCVAVCCKVYHLSSTQFQSELFQSTDLSDILPLFFPRHAAEGRAELEGGRGEEGEGEEGGREFEGRGGGDSGGEGGEGEGEELEGGQGIDRGERGDRQEVRVGDGCGLFSSKSKKLIRLASIGGAAGV